jgi:hypothetical protein
MEEEKKMKKLAWVLILFFLLGLTGTSWGAEAELRNELEMLKKRIEQLENQLKQKETEAKEEVEAAKAERAEIKETIEEKFGTLSIYGGVVGYYQGAAVGELNGASTDDPNGAGIVGDLELSFQPDAPHFEDGEFYMRLHAGEGTGADQDTNKDNDPVDVLFANLNTIADDNADESDDSDFRLLEAYYSHTFFDGIFSFCIGKTEPVAFLDDNAFANDEIVQFVGKPFVNDSVLDSEDEFVPLVALTLSPLENITLVALAASTTRPLLDGLQEEGPEFASFDQKSKYEDIFDDLFIGVQLTFSPEIMGQPGNYRIYGWTAPYEHPELDEAGDPVADKDDEGWGVGISLDQQITDKVGLFARAGYHNDNVYAVEWEASTGINIKGLVPNRKDDELAFGFAGLIPNSELENDDTEFHIEGYYRIAFTENLALTPDFQYVWNPGGDNDNDGIFAGMLRGEFSF